jgi:hypothetical protein
MVVKMRLRRSICRRCPCFVGVNGGAQTEVLITLTDAASTSFSWVVCIVQMTVFP